MSVCVECCVGPCSGLRLQAAAPRVCCCCLIHPPSTGWPPPKQSGLAPRSHEAPSMLLPHARFQAPRSFCRTVNCAPHEEAFGQPRHPPLLCRWMAPQSYFDMYNISEVAVAKHTRPPPGMPPVCCTRCSTHMIYLDAQRLPLLVSSPHPFASELSPSPRGNLPQATDASAVAIRWRRNF